MRGKSMIFIESVLVDEAILGVDFHCNIKRCKGACCVEGDFGAPLEEDEIAIVEEIGEQIKDMLPKESREIIKNKSSSYYYEKEKFWGTSLRKNGACIFAVEDKMGIVHCAMEQAYYQGKTSFKKPVSCELYPIRVEKNKENGLQTLVYDEWSICSPACEYGKNRNVKVFEFLERALIRKFGQEFFDKLKAYAEARNLK